MKSLYNLETTCLSYNGNNNDIRRKLSSLETLFDNRDVNKKFKSLHDVFPLIKIYFFLIIFNMTYVKNITVHKLKQEEYAYFFQSSNVIYELCSYD